MRIRLVAADLQLDAVDGFDGYPNDNKSFQRYGDDTKCPGKFFFVLNGELV